MASQLTVDNIVGATDASLVMVPGHVVQVKNFTTTAQTNTTSTSYIDTAITINITPTSASNKVLVRLYCALRADQVSNAGAGVAVVRNGANIGEQRYMGWNNVGQYGQDTVFIEILDSPATTSSVTYKAQVRTENGNNINFGHDNGIKGITVMEIAQ